MNMKRILSLLLCAVMLLSIFASCGVETPAGPGEPTQPTEAPTEAPSNGYPNAEKWMAFEIPFESEMLYVNPVYNYDMDVVFTHTESGKSFTQPAFWCGGTKWMVRVALTELGEWTYETKCTDTANAGLHGLTGGVNCVPYSGDLEIYKRGFLKTEKGTRYFMYDDGTPFFYLGDTHWTLPVEEIDGIGNITQDLADEYGITSQFEYIMDVRMAQGFTVMQTQPLGWYTGVSGNSWFGNAGGSIFDYGINDMIVEKFNQYDRYFAYIAEKGFVNANSQFAYPEELIETYLSGGISNQQLEKLCRYWVARYSAYPVMWTTTQEGDNDYYGHAGCTPENNPWLMVMEYVAKYDVYDHPTTCHQENTGNTVVNNSTFGEKKEHQWYAAQYTVNVSNGQLAPFGVLKEYYFDKDAKPTVNYEGRYDHFWTGTFGARAQGWVAFLNGNCGYGYGIQPIWSIVWAEYGEKTPTSDEVETYERDYNWVEGLYSEGGEQLIYMKKFLSGYDWYDLTPCFDGNEYYQPGTSKNYSVANDGDEVYIAYLYGTSCGGYGTFKNMKNGSYELVWLNCRTGESTVEQIVVENSTLTIPDKPDANDWVIAVRHNG